MSEIVNLFREEELQDAYLSEFRRHRAVSQSLFYTEGGATSFYSYRSEDLEKLTCVQECAFLERQPFVRRSKPFAFVSLGCGNAAAEEPTLSRLHGAGYDLAYFGVDSSRSMLELARATLAGKGFPRTYVLADFTRPAFQERLRPLLPEGSVHIYALIGGTFGNFRQEHIAAVLRRNLSVGDYLYLDLVPKAGAKGGVEGLSRRFAQLPQNYRLFFDSLLERLSIPQDAGEVQARIDEDTGLNSLRCTFVFRARDPLALAGLGDGLTVAPGEDIELLTIRAYDAGALRAYLEGQGFDYVDDYTTSGLGERAHLWQRFLFRRQE